MKVKRYVCGLICIFFWSGLWAEAGKVLQPEDHLKQVRVGDARVSPDGRYMVYSRSRYCPDREKRVSDLYLAGVREGEPRQLTATPGGEGGYSWSPDSKRIAFSARREGDEKEQVYVISIGGGEARRLTAIESGASDPLWSPDGRWIAFYSSVGELYTEEEKEILGDVRVYSRLRYYHLGRGWDDGRRRRIFVIPAGGGEAKQLTDGECADEGDHSMAWHPDSRTIAFVSNRSGEWWNTIDTDIYTVDVSTGEIRRLTGNPGPDHSPAFSPDGRYLAYRASYEYNYESENYRIHLMPAKGGKDTALTRSLDRSVRAIAWGPDSRRIYFTASDSGYRNLQMVSIFAPDDFISVTAGDHIVYSFAVIDHHTFVFNKTTDTLPTEIYTMIRGRLTRRTHAAGKSLEDYPILPSEEIRLKAEDGSSLQGWLIKPRDYRPGQKAPLLVNIHGGPHGMYSPSFGFEYQLYAHHGIAVLYTNPRGSDGYGQAFADVIHENWGDKPMADVMRFVDYAVREGIADPDKMAVKGGSYGGYLTNWMITHTDRFAAAVSVAGLFNMASFYGTTDEQFFPEKEMAGVPWEKKETYLKNSPLWYARNLQTPTLVIHGHEDWRVRVEQGEQLFTALQKMGIPSVYANFPGEQHGVRGDTHRTVYYTLILDWLKHWLKGEEISLARYRTPRAFVYPPRSAEK